MLQNYIFVPVDIFLEKLNNKGIESELDAWLTFLGSDEPEYIIKLIGKYPYFKQLYDDLYNMCLNTERMINMFSKELQLLDRNTVKYMIDELQDGLNEANDIIAAKNRVISEKDKALDEKDKALAEKDKALAALQAEINKLKNSK